MMKIERKYWVCVYTCLLLMQTAVSAAVKDNSDFKSLFNGKDLTGWEGADGWWQVKDGVLFSESTPEKPCKQSHYLYWKDGEPADFEFTCQWKITGPANTGIQFRSLKKPNWDTWGYQADIDAAGEYVGCLYQHDRGLVAGRGQQVSFDANGKKTVKVFGSSRELLKKVKVNDWNEYRVVAKGPKISLWINGTLMCEVEDFEPKFALPKGVLALQMHQGPPMKAEFKDLKIRELK